MEAPCLFAGTGYNPGGEGARRNRRLQALWNKQVPLKQKPSKRSPSSANRGQTMGGTSPAKKEVPAPDLKKVKDAVVHRVSAEDMAKKQREISVSEFFAKNRHLLGFDSPRKALLTAVKEAVDNSLDACEEARILPEIEVKIEVVGGLKP